MKSFDILLEDNKLVLPSNDESTTLSALRSMLNDVIQQFEIKNFTFNSGGVKVKDKNEVSVTLTPVDKEKKKFYKHKSSLEAWDDMNDKDGVYFVVTLKRIVLFMVSNRIEFSIESFDGKTSKGKFRVIYPINKNTAKDVVEKLTKHLLDNLGKLKVEYK